MRDEGIEQLAGFLSQRGGQRRALASLDCAHRPHQVQRNWNRAARSMRAAVAHRAAVIRVEARLRAKRSTTQRASIETRHQSGMGQGVKLEGNDGAWPGPSALERP